MAATVFIYNNGKRVGMTSKAFNCVIKEELMREYLLSFDIVNSDPIYNLINEKTSFKCDGQLFNVVGIDSESGANNITQIQAEHCSYELNNYNVPFGYAFVGTVQEIVQDLLNRSYAIVNDDYTTDANFPCAAQEFTVGECADLGTVSFSLNNEHDIILKDAILRLTAIGVEADYDNFTLNFPVSVGSDTGKVFEFGKDLISLRKRWTLGSDWTYDVSIASLHRVPGHEGDAFKKGDTVTVKNSITGESIEKRIVAHHRCKDDPIQDTITLGTFIKDAADDAIATEIKADTALNKAITSVQQGEQYSNVSIDHVNGFMAALQDGSVRVVMNANDCFAVQVPDGDDWKTIQELTAEGLGATKLFTPNSTDFYGYIGYNSSGYPGFFLVKGADTTPVNCFVVWPSADGDTFVDGVGNLLIRCGAGKKIYFQDTNGEAIGIDGGFSADGIFYTFQNGLIVEAEPI